MNNIVRIRKAALDDAAFLPSIERSSNRAFLTVKGLEWIADDAVMSKSDHITYIEAGDEYIAQIGTQPVGFIILLTYPSQLYIAELVVASEHQKMGIGSALLKKAETVAREKRLAALTLITFHNIKFNEMFYRCHGYDEGVTRPAYLEIHWCQQEAKGLSMQKRFAMIKWIKSGETG